MNVAFAMKTLLLRSVLFVFLFFLCPITGWAQSSASYSIRHFTNDNGLPQNSIKCMEMDRNGYLWLGTEAGLVRFDGSKFRLYDRSQYPVLYSNRITRTGLMPAGNIFFMVAGDSSLYTLNAEGYPSRQPFKAHLDFFCGTSTSILSIRDARNAKDGAWQRQINLCYIRNSDNNVFFFGSNTQQEGFLCFNKDKLAYVSKGKMQWVDSIPDCNIHIMAPCGRLQDRFYYLDEHYRLKGISSTREKSIVKVEGDVPDTTGLLPADYSLFQQEDGLYLHQGRRIYRLHPKDDHTLHSTHMLTVGDIADIISYRNFPGPGFQAVGSATQGLFLFRTHTFKAYRLEGKGRNGFYAQVPFGRSGVLTSLGIITPERQKRDTVFHNFKPQSILKDSKGQYWLNQQARYLVTLDSQLKLVKRRDFGNISITCIRETADGRIWLSNNQRKLGWLQGDYIHWLPIDPVGEGKSITSFLPVSDKVFWAGGANNLFRLDVSTGVRTPFPQFDSVDVSVIQQDSDGHLWIGTYGNGFYLYRDKKFIKLPEDEQGYLRIAHCFVEDKQGYLWIGTNNGLFRFLKKDLTQYIPGKSLAPYYQYFSKENGFYTNEFNGNCHPNFAVLDDGRISLPSMDGIVQFHPDSIRNILPDNAIFVDEVIADGEILSAARPELAPSFKRIEFHISSPYFGELNNQHIEYHIAGLNDAWYPVGKDNNIVLNTLAYGNYQLQLRKRAGFGSAKYLTTAFDFTVRPFFYQTWYFKLLLLLAVLLLGYVFMHVRYAWLVRQRDRLELEVQERTRDLVYSNRLKEKLTFIIAHDLQSPLHFMSLLSGKLDKLMLRNGNQEASGISRELKNTSEQIYLFVEEFHLWASTFSEHFHLSKMPFPLTELVRELQLFFKEMLSARNNVLDVHIEGGTRLITDRPMLKVILRNLIDNANKHTENGRIGILLLETEGRASIAVSDTGEGMSEHNLRRIQARIEQGTGSAAIEKSHRLGYQIILDFAGRLGATVQVTSTQGKGTTVVIGGLNVERTAEPIGKPHGSYSEMP